MALPRSVKVKRVLLVSLAAKFVAEAVGVRATANRLWAHMSIDECCVSYVIALGTAM